MPSDLDRKYCLSGPVPAFRNSRTSWSRIRIMACRCEISRSWCGKFPFFCSISYRRTARDTDKGGLAMDRW